MAMFDYNNLMLSCSSSCSRLWAWKKLLDSKDALAAQRESNRTKINTLCISHQRHEQSHYFHNHSFAEMPDS